MRRREFLLSAAAAGLRRAAPGIAAPKLAAIHVMVDMPDFAADPGRKFDPRRFIRLCRDARVDVIEFKCKNAVGDAMYSFRDRECPRDWVGETRVLARDAGIEFIAYYNVGLDNRMAKLHPEWQCVDPQGKPKIAFGAFNWMCLRSPWRDRVLDELRQLQQGLQPDGMWFDLLGAPNAYGPGSFDPAAACFCPHCRAAYKAKFGEEQPVTSDDPQIRLRVNRFGQEARIAMLRDAMTLLRKLDPQLELGYNGAGNYDRIAGTPEDLRALVTYNSSEAKPHRLVSFTAKMLMGLGKPFQVHTYGGFMRMQPGHVVGTWAAWNLIPVPYMQVTAAITSAHGGRLGLGVNPLPDGTVYADELRGAGRTFAQIHERERWLGGLESVPSVAVVYDWESELALLPLPATRNAFLVRQETTGLHDAMLDGRMHFDVVQSGAFRPGRYRVILLGDAAAPGRELTMAIREFVHGGGLLVATHETSLRDARGRRRTDFAWGDLLGVRFRGVSPFNEANYAWLGEELRGSAAAYPLLLTTPVLEVECTTARPLAELVYPEAHRTPEAFTDGETPHIHFQQFTGKPLVTINRAGKGAVVYIAAPIGREIATRQDPWLCRLVTRAVKLFASGLAIEMEAPPGVQVVFGRNGQAHVISLVNYHAGLALGTGEGPPPRVGPVVLRIPAGVLRDTPKTVTPVDAEGLRWRNGPAGFEIDVASIGVHALLVLA